MSKDKKKRRFRLRKPDVSRVDIVDRGANQHSHILLAKREEPMPKNDPGGYGPDRKSKPKPKPKQQAPQAPQPGAAPGGGEGGGPAAPATPSRPLQRPASPGVGQTPPTQRTPVSPQGGAGGRPPLQGMAGALQRMQTADPTQRPAAPPAPEGAKDDEEALAGEEDDQLMNFLRTHLRRRQMQKPPRKPKADPNQAPMAKASGVDNVLETITKGLVSAGVFTQDAKAEDLRDILPPSVVSTLNNIVSTSKSAGATQEGTMPMSQDELQALVDELPDEIINYIGDLEEQAATAQAEVEKARAAQVEDEGDDDPIAKALSELPPEVASIVKAQQDRLSEAEKALEASKIAKADETYITKAREFDGVIDKPEDFGPVLRQFAEAHPEAAETLEGQLRAASQVVTKSALFEEFGHSAPASGTAEGEVLAIAKSYQEANPDLSIEEARAKAWENNPEMYERYVEEQRQRTR